MRPGAHFERRHLHSRNFSNQSKALRNPDQHNHEHDEVEQLLVAPALGMYVLISHITNPTTTRITTYIN